MTHPFRFTWIPTVVVEPPPAVLSNFFSQKVESIAVNQSMMGKLLNYGEIVIIGSGGTHETFHSMQDPLEFRRCVESATAQE